MADETLQAVNNQSARLKADLRVLQQEKDSLKHEATVLHKQLQNVNEKVKAPCEVRLIQLKTWATSHLPQSSVTAFSQSVHQLILLIQFSRCSLLDTIFFSESYFGDGPALQWTPESE